MKTVAAEFYSSDDRIRLTRPRWSDLRPQLVALVLPRATAKPAELIINADLDAWYHADAQLMGELNHQDFHYQDFHAVIHNPAVVHAMGEDYRSGLGVDRAADQATGRRITGAVMILRAIGDDMVDLYGDPLTVWRPCADDVTGPEVDSGHHITEQAPGQLVMALTTLLSR